MFVFNHHTTLAILTEPTDHDAANSVRRIHNNGNKTTAPDMPKPNLSIIELSAQLEAHGVRVPAVARPLLFGNTPELARALADLVLEGKKRATASLPA